MRFSTVRFDLSHIFWLLKVLAERESHFHGKDISRITYHAGAQQFETFSIEICENEISHVSDRLANSKSSMSLPS